jgi:hypothetical protein
MKAGLARADRLRADLVSGISYAELKCMSDGTLNLLSDLCNVSVAAGLPPTGWCK